MLDLLEEFRSIVAALKARGVPFAVCGGLAVAIHVRPRATLDVDLLLPRDALAPAKETARGLGYTIEAGPISFREGSVEIHRLSKPDPATGDLLSLDLLVVTPTLAEVWEERERVAWEHGHIPVVSRRGLVSMKRLRDSGQDRDDVALLETASEGEDGD